MKKRALKIRMQMLHQPPDVEITRLSCFEFDADDANVIIGYEDSDAEGDCPRDVGIPDGITELGARLI